MIVSYLKMFRLWQVAANVASALRAAVRTDLATRMTEHATEQLAETASDEAAQWAAHAAIPSAVGECDPVDADTIAASSALRSIDAVTTKLIWLRCRVLASAYLTCCTFLLPLE